MPTTNPNLTKAQRREAALSEALALKKKQEAADRRARVVTMSVLGVVVLALVGIVAFLFVRDHRTDAANPVDEIPLSQVADVPSTARDDGGIPLGTDRSAGGPSTDGVPEVAVYFDYMCPNCGMFEQANQANLESLIQDGAANVVMFPVSILDRVSQGTGYSTRAAAASAWVADKAPRHWLDFHEALYVGQAEEQTPGLTNQQLADRAEQAGVPADVVAGIASGEARRTFGQWVYSATGAISADPTFQGTPTIKIGGKRWDGTWTDPAALPQAVADATK
ncbi:DsbA family protein [Xylanimonas sp. McL0601]|uniref:DsbA family protein n=1 Tax=Xylanimonas sp. McL0601 TaxID=3414739 RepID=UPI003CE88295